MLTEHYTRKQGTRETVDLNFYTASKELYDVPFFTPRLLEIYKERNIPINLNVRVKGVDTAAKQVHFEKIETVGDQKVYTPFVEDYDFLHFTPPMSAPDFVREAGLGWTEGKLAADALGYGRQRDTGTQNISEYRFPRRRSRNPDQQNIRCNPQASADRSQEPDLADGRQRTGREIRRICRLPDRDGLRACSLV